MTKEGLKKKICKIIADNYLPKEMPDRLEDYKLYRFKRAADALIAAGLKFDTIVSHTATFDLMQQEQINSLERRCAQAEHRAEVAEAEIARCKRAFRIAGDKFINEVCNMRGEDISDKCDYKCDTCFYDYYLQQAEKELAEVRKDE